MENNLVHSVDPSKMIKEGKIVFSVKKISNEEVKIITNYSIKIKSLFKVINKDGVLDLVLPKKFMTEEFFQDLKGQKKKEREVRYKQYSIAYLGQNDTERFSACHKVKIRDEKEKWEAIVFFNSTAPSPSWVRFEVIYPLPALGKLSVVSNLA